MGMGMSEKEWEWEWECNFFSTKEWEWEWECSLWEIEEWEWEWELTTIFEKEWEWEWELKTEEWPHVWNLQKNTRKMTIKLPIFNFLNIQNNKGHLWNVGHHTVVYQMNP